MLLLIAESIYTLDTAVFVEESAEITFQNGTEDGVHFRIGAMMTFDCEEGYVMDGADERRLLSGGVWSDVPPTCTGRHRRGYCRTY